MTATAIPILRRAAALFLAAALAAGCETTQAIDGDGTLLGYAPEFPDLTCSANATVPLTASRMRAGDVAYLEFRQRNSPAIPAGHMFVVFGRLDPEGRPATRQYIGLFPVLGPVGLYGGAVVPVPGELKPSGRDCSMQPNGAYRLSLSEAQYQKLLARVRHVLDNPPLWHMAFYNCNHFAISMGLAVGMKAPQDALLTPPAYLAALIELNGST